MLASVAVLAVASLSVSSCSKTNGSLVGTKWIGVDDVSVMIDFNTETTCVFSVSESDDDGENLSLTLPYVYEKPNVSIGGGIINGTVDKDTMILYNPDGEPLTLRKL